MSSISLCLGLEGSLHGCSASVMTEEMYREIFTTFIKTLYEWTNGMFSVHFSGPVLQWLKIHHSEFSDIAAQLIMDKRLEIIGGGYHEPLFPLLPNASAEGQLELLNDFITRNFRKRPHGCWITGSAWDASIIPSLQTCGFSYAFLDTSLVFSCAPDDYDRLQPVITEDNGKPLILFPTMMLQPLAPLPEPEEVIDYLLKNADDSGNRIVTFFIPAIMIPQLFRKNGKNSPWIKRFSELLENHRDVISLQLPSTYLKSNSSFPRAYVPQGVAPSVLGFPFEDKNNERLRAMTSIKTLLLQYPEAADIYYKMIFVNALVTQLRGDKSRKKVARDKLLEAQNCHFFWNNGCMGVSNREVRDIAYKTLLDVEKTTRETQNFTPSLSGFDYDADGVKEYVCIYPGSGIYIHPRGGSIFEFDNLSVCHNYVNIGSRRADNSIDAYRHKMFVDHLISSSSIAKIRHNGTPERSVFPRELYREVSCDRTKLELTLKAVGKYSGGTFEQPISLRKKFIFRKEGIQVQYILKNESPFALSAVFMSELNLSLPGNSPEKQNVKIFSKNTVYSDVCTSSEYEDVEWVCIEDLVNNISFQIESNENGFVIFRNLTSASVTGKSCCEQYEASQLFFAWNIDIAPNYEMEKTVFLKVSESIAQSKEMS